MSDETEEQEDFYFTDKFGENGDFHVLNFRGHQFLLLHRKVYKPYDETPTKGHLGMNARTKKFLAKRAIELIAATVIGYIIKAEKNFEGRVDEHFAPPKADTPEED